MTDNVVNVRLAVAELIRDILFVHNIHAIMFNHVPLFGMQSNGSRGRNKKLTKGALSKEEILTEIKEAHDEMMDKGDQEIKEMLSGD